MFPVFLFLIALGTNIVQLFAANGSKDEIEQADPDYAKRLFNSAGDQLILKAGPVRIWPLFFERSPDSIKSTVSMLRCVCGANLLLSIACGGYLITALATALLSTDA